MGKTIKLIAICLILFWAVACVYVRTETASNGKIIISNNGVAYELWGHRMTSKNLILRLSLTENKSRTSAVKDLFMANNPEELAKTMDTKNPWHYKIVGDNISDLFGARIWGEWVLINPTKRAETFFREKATECGYGRKVSIQIRKL